MDQEDSVSGIDESHQQQALDGIVPELQSVGFQVVRRAGVELASLGRILAGQRLGTGSALADAAGAA